MKLLKFKRVKIKSTSLEFNPIKYTWEKKFTLKTSKEVYHQIVVIHLLEYPFNQEKIVSKNNLMKNFNIKARIIKSLLQLQIEVGI